jgi:hypothetical protein
MFGKHIGPTYLDYMYFQEPDQVDQVRQRHRLLLTEDPLQVLHENPIVGDLLPNTMDSHPGWSGKINRYSTIKSFGYLYCDRLRKMVQKMTLEEVQDNVVWDDWMGPQPKQSWIRYLRFLDYFWNRFKLLEVNPTYIPHYVNPRPIYELPPEFRRQCRWIGLHPESGQYQDISIIPCDDVPYDIQMFQGCIEAAQWFTWRLWPKAGVIVYPPNYAQLESKIPKVQKHLRIMRENNPTWGRTTSTLNNWGWESNN